jgi:hypothetical protein
MKKRKQINQRDEQDKLDLRYRLEAMRCDHLPYHVLAVEAIDCYRNVYGMDSWYVHFMFSLAEGIGYETKD